MIKFEINQLEEEGLTPEDCPCIATYNDINNDSQFVTYAGGVFHFTDGISTSYTEDQDYVKDHYTVAPEGSIMTFNN